MSPNIPEKLLNQYHQSLRGKIVQLKELVQAVERGRDQTSLIALRAFIHKMGGSAGTYGYPEVSALCKEWDKLLIETIQKGLEGDLSWLKQLPHDIQKGFHLEEKDE